MAKPRTHVRGKGRATTVDEKLRIINSKLLFYFFYNTPQIAAR